jgi:hypothetical protein
MADICMCLDNRCPSRTLCYRFTAKKDEYRQSYWAKSPRKPHAVRCEEFWSNKGIPDPTDYSVNEPPLCKCNLFGMSHKRTNSCDVFEQLTDICVPQKGTNVPKLKRRKV